MRQDLDWALIVAVLHGSEWDGITNPRVEARAYAEGDGFGKRTPAELREINGGWDWSHIRDSSPEAKVRIARVLRDYFRTL